MLFLVLSSLVYGLPVTHDYKYRQPTQYLLPELHRLKLYSSASAGTLMFNLMQVGLVPALRPRHYVSLW